MRTFTEAVPSADLLLSLAVKVFKVKWAMITVLTPRHGYFVVAAGGFLPCLRGTVVCLRMLLCLHVLSTMKCARSLVPAIAAVTDRKHGRSATV